MAIEPLGNWLTEAPWKNAGVSLIDFAAGVQEHTLSGKRAMVADYGGGGALHVAWTGKYRTDIRRIAPDEVPKVAEHLG